MLLCMHYRSAAGAGEDNEADRAKCQHTGMGQPIHAAAAASDRPRAVSASAAAGAAAAAAAASSSDDPHPPGSASTRRPTGYPEHDGPAPMSMDSDDDK